MLKYVVCAARSDEAQAWAEAHGIPQQQCIYAGSVQKLDGLRDFAVIQLRSFFERPDHEQIEAVLRRCEMKMLSPGASADGAGR